MRATLYPSYATQHVKLTIATAETGCLICNDPSQA